MKRINPYQSQKNIQLIFSLIGAAGMVTGLYFFFGDSDNSALISSAMYPFFVASGLIQYFQLRKKYIRFTNEKVEWDFASIEHPQKIDLVKGTTVVDSNWKGVVLKNGEKEYEISLDGIWKRDRKRIISEMKEFYKVA